MGSINYKKDVLFDSIQRRVLHFFAKFFPFLEHCTNAVVVPFLILKFFKEKNC